MRLFAAINLPESEKLRLAASLAGAAAQIPAIRWLAAESLHITLKFLGQVDASRLDEVRGALRAAASESAAFDVAIGGFGAFPSAARPRIFWVGVEPVARLLELQANVERRLAPLGFEAESREFTPHITVGRPRKGPEIRDRQLVDRIAGAFDYNTIIPAGSLDLMRSHIGSVGARYEVMNRMELP